MLKFADEAVAQLRVWRHGLIQPENMFIILFYGRSGSGLLRTLINCHPDIYCDAEIYLHRKAFFPRRYLLNRSKVYGKKFYGHKAKLFQLEEQYGDDYKIKENYLTGVKIIFLTRDNLFRQAVSGLIGLQRGKWHDIKKNTLKGQKFNINAEMLIDRMKRIDTYSKKKKKLLKGFDYLVINYEKDLLIEGNHQHTADKIFEYLGIYSVPVNTSYVKSTPDNLEKVIGNYEEIVEAIKNSEYARFLNDIGSAT